AGWPTSSGKRPGTAGRNCRLAARHRTDGESGDLARPRLAAPRTRLTEYRVTQISLSGVTSAAGHFVHSSGGWHVVLGGPPAPSPTDPRARATIADTDDTITRYLTTRLQAALAGPCPGHRVRLERLASASAAHWAASRARAAGGTGHRRPACSDRT